MWLCTKSGNITMKHSTDHHCFDNTRNKERFTIMLNYRERDDCFYTKHALIWNFRLTPLILFMFMVPLKQTKTGMYKRDFCSLILSLGSVTGTIWLIRAIKSSRALGYLSKITHSHLLFSPFLANTQPTSRNDNKGMLPHRFPTSTQPVSWSPTGGTSAGRCFSSVTGMLQQLEIWLSAHSNLSRSNTERSLTWMCVMSTWHHWSRLFLLYIPSAVTFTFLWNYMWRWRGSKGLVL